ncbi:biotin--[acetyl-CoA-carboxylase] ligase [Rufibacter glacialis]|uniref:Biotin--[acetyl-CoA-carboxylase] ligase n=1 Tax=Rufibacter glacialis TaxID=1259555 RepID=A0A5M8QRK5_9BACT|nr:biotin--[acetyl-CoA-carboxylase] ligase [Rufibacter glacialis]KAA6437851.1 biotin--[acetyl-CoA-carboxylase] ligase [Rufibacter glacialis]GGK58274.1 biotin--[acetyl-CoA-carboxylase] ligase [Rufibacter glacialis]
MPECASTNTEAHLLLNKNGATDGCVIVAGAQTGGRGQRGNVWEVEPDKNITLSAILKPTFLEAQHQFSLNVAVSLAALDLLREYVPTGARLKWPNDLYVQDQKAGGILIENTISGHRLQHSVIGIGINVNQVTFAYPQATSLALVTGRQLPLARLIDRLLENLEHRYLALRSGGAEAQKREYLQHLYRYQEWHRFEVKGQVVQGQIAGVDTTGRLAVLIEQKLEFFQFQEIKFVL